MNKWLKYAPKVLQEAYEIVDDADVDNDINKKSARYACQFLEKIFIHDRTLSPDCELHPDNELAFTFRNGKGILNVAFNEWGRATWAVCYKNRGIMDKGKFTVSHGIPDLIVEYIERCRG